MKIALNAAAFTTLALVDQVSAQAAEFPTSAPGPYADLVPELSSIAETCVPEIYEGIVGLSQQPEYDGTQPADDTSGTGLTWWNQYFTSVAQTGTCNDGQKSSMEAAFSDFKTCSGGLDMMAFIQYLPSVVLGASITCFLEIAAVQDVLSAETFTAGASKIVMTDTCMEAMFGSNIMGDMLRAIFTEPDKVLPCFKTMADAVPLCTYPSWPMPLVGTWLQGGACFLGSAIPMLESMCEIELTTLDTCIDLNDPDVCANAYDSCISGDPLSYMMLLPSKILGMPLMDTCIRISKSNAALESGVEKYNGFVQQCVSVWSGWTDKQISQPPEPMTTTTSSAGRTRSLAGYFESCF